MKNKREMILKMIASISGGREVVAAYLGMSLNSLNNRIYEKKGQTLSLDDLLQIQELSKSTHLADFCAPEHFVLVEEPQAVECDEVELARLMIMRTGVGGEFEALKKEALKDGVLTKQELKGIIEKKRHFFSLLEKELKTLELIYSDTAELKNV